MTLTSDGRGRPIYGPVHPGDVHPGWFQTLTGWNPFTSPGRARSGSAMRRSLVTWRSRLGRVGWGLLAVSAGSLVVGPLDTSWGVLGILAATAPFAARQLLASGFRCPRCTAPIDWRHEATHCDRCASPLP